MDSVYSKFFTGNSRYNNLSRSGSLPLFNTRYEGGRLPSCLTYNDYNRDKPFASPEILKMQMMEERLKELEKQKYQQNDQINALMSYQMNQNRLNKSNSAILLPVNQQPTLLLTGNSVLQPLNYANNLNRYYDIQRYQDMNNPFNRTLNGVYDYKHRKKTHSVSETEKELYRKHRKLQKSYLKNMEAMKDYIDKGKIDEKINKNLHKKIYLPIKNDINNFMEEINYNLQKKMENDNNIVNSNINAVQSNYDEIKYLLEDKINKMELKQKMDFENLKHQLHQTAKNKEKENNILNNELLQMRMMELENKNKSRKKEQLLELELNGQISEEVRKQRELDEMKHQKELDALRRKHEIEDLENKKYIEELRFQKMKNNIMKQKYKKQSQPQVYPMIQQMPLPFIYPMPSSNNNGNNNKTGDELFKLFMMKSIFGTDLFGSREKKKKVRYRYVYRQ